MSIIKHILVVEDEVIIGELISDILKTQGYLISIVRTGKELYVLLSGTCTQLYSLVVTDINLPGYFGDEAIEMASCFSKKIPILFISGMPKPKAIREDLFLSKPFSREDFLSKIDYVLKGETND